MLIEKKNRLSSPWIFTPMLFVAIGLGGGGIVGTMTSVMFKDFGFSNALIGAVALLSLPSAFRFLWSPWIDALGSKRRLCFTFTAIIGVILMVLSIVIYTGYMTPLLAFSLILCFALLFSCLEVSSDGYYIRVFDKAEQAEFVGIKTAAIRGGIILSLVLFVRLAGQLQEDGAALEIAWGKAMGLASVTLLVLAVYYLFGLPKAKDDYAVKDTGAFPLFTVLKEYVQQRRAWAIIAMLLIFRFGQGMQVYMVPPFLMDAADAGGFAMNAKEVAMLKTYADVPFMIIGGILGGFIIKWFGLRKTLIPFTMFMNLPNFAYIFLAIFRPQAQFMIGGTEFYTYVFGTAVVETLGYGIGFSAFFYYLHAIADGEHKTSMLAISSGIMGLGFYIPGGISGVLQQMLGYPSLFVLSSTAGLLTLAIIPFLPMEKIAKPQIRKV
ncbi:muropeptide transporter [Limihaloglobus sulfuriphilus]|uniref:Muropeptide transporter n=1 Tax=Limihaloglobus sulfuriphilus TaxID=1851148 RepID=A0A1Q2MEK6_9BACT|nr:MFS transporter [Limihaloglobus sulfuriphilus]AQQ71131.1 muropeptide transporter [Limihaloglobus sulfuriphilus]